MKRFLLLLVFITLFSIFPKEISAQGVFECVWVPTGQNTGICVTDVNNIRCTGNATPNTQFCTNSGQNQQSCESATPTCVAPQGYRCTNPEQNICDPCTYQVDPGCNYASPQACGVACQPNNGTAQPSPTSQPGTGGTAERVQEDCDDGEISTGIGCIPFNDINALTRFFLGWALGIAGGIALLMIGFAGYKIATSQGDPRRLQGGQELLMSAIGGLLMVVLSVYLLRFIGVDLLGLF